MDEKGSLYLMAPTKRDRPDAHDCPRPRTDAPTPMGDPRRPLPQPDGDRARQHHPQRRPAHARPPAARHAPARCSGSSTSTPSCSPGCCSPPARWATASAGTRRLTLGLALFGLGSLASALAGSTAMLIATRAFMGIGGAFIMPSTLSIITNVFTDPVERGKAIGIWAGVAGARHRDRPGGRRVPAQPLLLGLGLLRQRADRGPGPGRRLVPRARLRGSDARPGSTRSAPCCRSSGLAALLWAVIEAPVEGWGSTQHRRRPGCRRRRPGRLRLVGAALPRAPCSTCGSSRTPGSPRPAWRSPSRSSRCSARCSC